jgi:hypothetical protein
MDNKAIECICDYLYDINGFASLSEFRRFEAYLNDLVANNELEVIQVETRFDSFEQKWFRCKSCKQIWVLVYPDYSFKGFFRRRDSKNFTQ